MAKKRNQEQLKAYIDSLPIGPETIEYWVVESTDMPLAYVLTSHRLIGTYLYESGGVTWMSIPYREISAITVDDDGPFNGLLTEIVAREINVLGSFGRLGIHIRDDENGRIFYAKLLAKTLR